MLQHAGYRLCQRLCLTSSSWRVDFCAKSVLGVGYPHLVRPKGCRLKCVVERTRLAYNKKLYQLSCRHRMWTKMERLTSNADNMTRADTSEGMNKFDGKHVQHFAQRKIAISSTMAPSIFVQRCNYGSRVGTYINNYSPSTVAFVVVSESMSHTLFVLVSHLTYRIHFYCRMTKYNIDTRPVWYVSLSWRRWLQCYWWSTYQTATWKLRRAVIGKP
jgi:hypothetical protein